MEGGGRIVHSYSRIGQLHCLLCCDFAEVLPASLHLTRAFVAGRAAFVANPVVAAPAFLATNYLVFV